MPLIVIERYLLMTLFVAAGINHFWHPAFYVQIIPDYIPWPRFWVAVSGLLEIALGGSLGIPGLRAWAAWGLIGLLVAFLPVHIYMVQNPERFAQVPLWILWGRLPLQGILIAWVYRQT